VPTVAQLLNAAQTPERPGRWFLARVSSVTGRTATVTLMPGDAETTAQVPLDINPTSGQTVLLLVAPAANVILARLELPS
jgi:hypothetical protein